MNNQLTPATVVIVDDDTEVRNALALLMSTAGFTTRDHKCGERLLAAGPPPGPACLLLDLSMPGRSGIEIQKQLQADGWDIPVIFLTGHADVPAAVKALKQGALDLIEKPAFDAEHLLAQVRRAIELHRRQLAHRAKSDHFQKRMRRLTVRELEVAHLAAGGMANKVIATQLGISERTVEIHRGRAMKKLGLRSAAELVRLERQLDMNTQEIS